MENFINISTRNDILMTSEVGWISNKCFILTLNNEYNLVRVKHKDLIKLKGGIAFGR